MKLLTGKLNNTEGLSDATQCIEFRKLAMKPRKKADRPELAPELEALLENARPVDALDLKGLAEAFEELNKDPDFVADSTKGIFVEDVLRALDECAVNKSELARRMGKSRQQINVLLDEEKKNNFTIETMAQISTALGQRLIVRMVPNKSDA